MEAILFSELNSLVHTSFYILPLFNLQDMRVIAKH